MTLDRNKQVVQTWIADGVNTGDMSVADELVDPNVLQHGPQGDVRGVDAAKGSVATLRAAFPDLQLAIDDLIAEGDRVVTRWTARGTHRGEFMGIPPAGRSVSFEGISIYRISSDGKISEVWPSFDALGLLRQLGKTL